jgi:sec-independent protein translocase protein TatC
VPNLLPHLLDMPMSLGDHLEELRRRLILPIGVFILLFIGGFACQTSLKLVMVHPLERAVAIVGVERARSIGMEVGTTRLLQTTSLAETLMTAVDLSMAFALAVTIPLLLYQLWMFVVVGLKRKERALGFLFIPGAMLFFYSGILLGYFIGLPYFYAWMIELNALDPSLKILNPRLEDYFGEFISWTLCFGLVMDIPWLVMVLIRVGIVSAEKFVRWRKFAVLANIVVAAMITPGGDPMMLVLTFVPMQLLFEAGLALGRLLGPRRADPPPPAEAA